jgi:hypothetical protein
VADGPSTISGTVYTDEQLRTIVELTNKTIKESDMFCADLFGSLEVPKDKVYAIVKGCSYVNKQIHLEVKFLDIPNKASFFELLKNTNGAYELSPVMIVEDKDDSKIPIIRNVLYYRIAGVGRYTQKNLDNKLYDGISKGMVEL